MLNNRQIEVIKKLIDVECSVCHKSMNQNEDMLDEFYCPNHCTSFYVDEDGGIIYP